MPTVEEMEGTLCGAMRGRTAAQIVRALRSPHGFPRYEELVLLQCAAGQAPETVLISGQLSRAVEQLCWRTVEGKVFYVGS